MKDTFIIRTEWADAIFELEPADQAQIFRNLFYFHQGNESLINLNNLTVKLVWKLIQPNLIRNIDSYDKRKETSSLNGQLGGRPKKEAKTDENNLNNLNQNLNNLTQNLNNLTEPNETLSVIVFDSVSAIDNNTISSVPEKTDLTYFEKIVSLSEQKKEEIPPLGPPLLPKPPNILFSEIWEIYDKKIGSIKKLQKKWEALSDKQRELVKTHITDYVKSTPDKKFRANFETYLNQERWTNEILNPLNSLTHEQPPIRPKQFATTDGR